MTKYVLFGIAAAVVIGAVVLLIKLVSGAFALIGGALNAILGVAVVLALIVIVIWMFRYAKKNQ